MSSEPKHAPRARRTPFLLLVVGLLAGGMCLLLALNTASAANEVARHDLTTNDQSAAAQLVELENEVQASAAPANLAAAAAALGMVPAGNPGFLEIKRNGTVRVMGSAAPASLEPVVIPHPAPTATKTPRSTPAPHKSGKRDAPGGHAKTTAGASKSAAKGTSAAAARTTAKARRAHAHGATAPTSSAAASPTPTPTPTPETTLPGGNR